jgi:hypothetical protein
MQGTADLHHQIADTLLPQTDAVFHDTTALDAAVDMLDPQPTVVQRLVGPLLRLRSWRRPLPSSSVPCKSTLQSK